MPSTAKNKHLCVHGHFYQPPRENPWTGGVDPEESARPYRDWNARIAQECYGPNGCCPVLDAQGRVVDMADNYARISYNFGPTLLNWLRREQPRVYERALAHPENAVAQPYIHAILPLQTRADRRLLIRWGLDDFERRYGRKALGMWLPETGVDDETLEDLADAGVVFTILAPSQAARIRAVGSEDWKEVDERTLKPTTPFRWVSKRDKSRALALFFFHAGLHRAVVSGDAFKAPDTLFHMVFGRTLPDDSTQLITIATDGEFFGHHHKRGAAALAQTLLLSEDAGLHVQTPASFLSLFPPPQEVQIRERTAWSCEHGLGRWLEDCGCRSPHLPSWSQAWRGPLRAALDRLSEKLVAVYEENAGALLRDYQEALRRYPERLHDPKGGFLERQQLRPLSPEERTKALALLEMQHQRLAMFTSCGWFFDDPTGIETVQILRHAARACELAARFGADLLPAFSADLEAAKSNVKQHATARGALEKLALPTRVDARRLAAHVALLEHLRPGLAAVPAGWTVERSPAARARKVGLAGKDRGLTAVRLSLTELALEETTVLTAVVHERDRMDFSCRLGPGGFDAGALFEAFEAEDDDRFERRLDGALGASYFTLDALLPEERGEAIRWLTPDPVGGAPRREYLDRWVAAVVQARDGRGADEALELLLRASEHKLPVDRLPWASAMRGALTGILEGLLDGADEASLSRAGRWLDAFERAGLHVDVWSLQELFWRWRERLARRDSSPAERRLCAAFGEKLGFADSVLPMEMERQ